MNKPQNSKEDFCLSNEKIESTSHTFDTEEKKKWGSEFCYAEEKVKEFIKRDTKNLNLYETGIITFTEYCNRRIKLAGEKLT